MRKSKKPGDHEEFNIWQPAADMMTALLFIALLIILLLGLYLVYRPNTSGNGKYNHEGTVTADTEEDDDDTATTNKQEEQMTGGGGGDQEDEFPIQIPSGGGGGTPEDEGIKTAVYAETLIAQEFYGLADMYDCLFLISTSGNSRNLQYAAIVAKAKHIPVILLTGPNKGSIEKYADVVIRGKGRTTAEIQDQHTPIYHCLCQMLEDEKFAQVQPASVSEHKST